VTLGCSLGEPLDPPSQQRVKRVIHAHRQTWSWRSTALVGTGLASGLILARVLPDVVGWLALLLGVVGGHWLAESVHHAPPTAEGPRTVAATGIWLTLVLAGAVNLAIQSSPAPEATIASLGAGLMGALAHLERRRGAGAHLGIWSAAIGYLALYLAALSLIERGAPATIFAAWTGALASGLTLDQLPSESAWPHRPISALVAGLSLAQVALLLGFLPVQAWAAAALTLLLAYTWIGLLRQEATGCLTRRVAREYALLLIGGSVALGVFGR
jgi:hypothetical protein